MQQAGEDLLDQILFHELVVHNAMTKDELEQLLDVVVSVHMMVKEKFSGNDVAIVTHLSLCFLEIFLADDSITQHSEYVKADVCSKFSSSNDELVKVKGDVNDAVMAILLAMTNKNYDIDASFALKVLDKFASKFATYSPLVRGNLVHRCFAMQFEYSSALTYCWLVNKGVLNSDRKAKLRAKSTTRNFSDFPVDFAIRLNLISMFESFKTTNIAAFGKIESNIQTLSLMYQHREKWEYTKVEALALSELKARFEAAEWNKNPLLGLQIDQLASPDHIYIQQFYASLYPYSLRFRMHSGTLATWPSLIAAANVWAVIESDRNPCPILFDLFEDYYSVPDNVRMVFFSQTSDSLTVAHHISSKLGERYFHQLSAQTLNDVKKKTLATIIRRVLIYSALVRESNFALSVDVHYLGTMVSTAAKR